MASFRVALATALVISSIGYQAGCGGEDVSVKGTSASGASSTSGTGGAGGAGEGGGGGATPGCTDPGSIVLAMTKIWFGDKNTDGTPASDAWTQFGFNVDGLVSTAMSKDVCLPNSNGDPAKAYPDGNNGIDNSFGKNVVPIVLSVDKGFTDSANEDITEGKFTIMFRMNGLTVAADQGPLTTLVYVGAKLGTPPKFDGSDCWPVIDTVLNDPKDIDSAKVILKKSAVAKNVWHSGDPTTLVLSIPAAGGALDVTIRQAVISMVFDKDHQDAFNGQIGGVLDTEEFVAQVKKVAGNASQVFCSGPVIDNIVQSIRQSSDILKDGTQDPAATCDGISIGLGFEAKAVGLGGISPSGDPPPDPCSI